VTRLKDSSPADCRWARPTTRRDFANAELLEDRVQQAQTLLLDEVRPAVALAGCAI
jgi:hypothetical protein